MHHLTSALAVSAALLFSGQALGASINCTVAAPSLAKRLCESNACPVHQTVVRGETLHAACRAYCGTDKEPWIKLYDGTYVLATSESVSGCRNFCQPYSIQGLPLCEEKTVSCHHTTLKPRSASPIPLGPEPAPSYAIAAKCNLPFAETPAAPAVGLARRAVLQSQSHTPSSRGVNETIYARGVNGTVYARGINGISLLARGANTTTDHANIPAGIFPPNLSRRALNTTAGHPSVRRYNWNLNSTTVGGWTTVVRRSASPDAPLNATLAARAPYVNATTVRGHAERNAEGSGSTRDGEVKRRSVADPAFRNGTWSGGGAFGRRSPKVLRKLKLWA